MTDDTRCPGCNLPIDSGTHTFGCPHLGSYSIPVMISPGWGDEIAAAVEGERELRAILTDLIAELRQASGDDRWIHFDGHYCTPVLPLTVAADRAEARLREVTGDE